MENLLRQDLNPVEEAEALQRLMDAHAYQQDQLVEIIGKSKATISESLSLNRLPQAIRDECRQDPTVPKNVLVEIAFPLSSFSAEDRAMLIETMNAMKDILDAGHHPGGEEQEKPT